MQTRRITRTRVLGLLEGAVLGGCLVAALIVGASSDRQAPSESGMQAWTERLQGQADALRQARVWAAWTEHLNGLAREAGASDRAMDAWTERLNGLAEEYFAGH